jgi:hypothetical protein
MSFLHGRSINSTRSKTLELIERRHPEIGGGSERILETLLSPNYVQNGDSGTLIAVKHYPKTPLTEKYCCVVYRELSEDDGFILTAYFASWPAGWRDVVWKR